MILSFFLFFSFLFFPFLSFPFFLSVFGIRVLTCMILCICTYVPGISTDEEIVSHVEDLRGSFSLLWTQSVL